MDTINPSALAGVSSLVGIGAYALLKSIAQAWRERRDRKRARRVVGY